MEGQRHENHNHLTEDATCPPPGQMDSSLPPEGTRMLYLVSLNFQSGKMPDNALYRYMTRHRSMDH